MQPSYFRFFAIALLFFAGSLYGQTTPVMTEYKVGTAGCRISLPATPAPVTMEYSADGSKVYTIDCVDSTLKSPYHFGAIVVELKEGVADEEMVNNYMEYLQMAFEIKDADGTSIGYRLATHPTAVGVSDFWYEKSGDKWNVLGWAAEGYMIVQYVYGPANYSNGAVLDSFLKSARFPGDK